MSGFKRFIAFTIIPIILYGIFYFIDKNNDKEILKIWKKNTLLFELPKHFCGLELSEVYFAQYACS